MLSIAFTKAELLRMVDEEFNEEKKDVKKKCGFSLISGQAFPMWKMENWAFFVDSFNCMMRRM